MRCSPAAASPGPMPRSNAANSPSPPAPPGTWPDLTGLSCRFEEFRAARGLILAVLVMPAPDGDPDAFRALTEDIVALVENSPEAGRPLPAGGPKLGWPPQGLALETHTLSGGGFKRARVLARTLLYFLVMRSGLRVGRFVPATYLRQVVENSEPAKSDHVPFIDGAQGGYAAAATALKAGLAAR